MKVILSSDDELFITLDQCENRWYCEKEIGVYDNDVISGLCVVPDKRSVPGSNLELVLMEVVGRLYYTV